MIFLKVGWDAAEREFGLSPDDTNRRPEDWCFKSRELPGESALKRLGSALLLSGHDFRFYAAILTELLFAICTVLLLVLPLNKHRIVQMAGKPAERRKTASILPV